jgi:hypothetical protein
MAISQNVGTTITALLPALFATVAPPGSTNVPLTIGSITFAITIIAAVAAWSARETYRIHIKDLGQPGAVPVDKGDYDRLRAASIAGRAAGPGMRSHWSMTCHDDQRLPEFIERALALTNAVPFDSDQQGRSLPTISAPRIGTTA